MKEKEWLLLVMVEEKVYGRYQGEQCQRQGHLGKARVNMDRLSWGYVRRGKGGTRGTTYQEGWPGPRDWHGQNGCYITREQWS